jgi:hypothetical protein
MDRFFQWERASRDTIDFKKIYVDMAGGDVLAGLVLSEIVYWYLPTKEGGSKLRVEHEGKFWIAARRYEWYERVRITPDQSDRILAILVKTGLIEKKLFQFNRDPTLHLRLVEDRFLALWNEWAAKPFINPYTPEAKLANAKIPFSPNGENGGSRQTAKRELPNGENLLAKRREPLTETIPTEGTSETNKDLGADAPAASNGNGTVKNAGALAALQKFEARKGEIDFSSYPEDTREIIREVCRLWKLVPPAKAGKKAGQHGLWINEARDLREACGEFGLNALRAYHEDWKGQQIDKRFMPGRPGSLTYYVTAKAAELRASKPAFTDVDSFEVFQRKNLDLFGETVTENDYQIYLRGKGVKA